MALSRQTVGYANGHKPNPSYEEVCSHTTGHAEACAIEYDEAKISLSELLTAFWRVVDPTLKDQQGTRCRQPVPDRYLLCR